MTAEHFGHWRTTRRVFLRAGSAILAAGAAGARAADAAPLCRFGFVTDLHYADADPLSNRYYRESAAKLAECVGRAQTDGAAFLIECGDFKDQKPQPDETSTLGFLQSIEAVLQQFGGPTYHVLGNHDMDSISKAQFQAHVTNTGIAPERTYYSFQSHDVHFVVLDANFTRTGTPYDHGNFNWEDANIPAEQLDWLAADLAANPLPVIVFCHQRLDGEGPHYVKNAAAVRPVLQAGGRVLAVFQGHDHAGGYRQLRGIHYVTGIALVEGSGEANSAYAMVEVFATGDLAVTGYRRQPSHTLAAPPGNLDANYRLF